MALGMIMFMHPGTLGEDLQPFFEAIGLFAIAPGAIIAMTTMMGWWRDVIREATFERFHTPVVQVSLRYGMALFIASEVMFFAAFFWAFFDASLFPKAAVDFIWPPPGVETFNAFEVPFLNTLVLLTSGFTVTWAHHDIREGNMAHATKMLAITVALGAAFTALQAFEYAVAGFGFRDGIYSSTFFMATGFHGFHVIVGTIFLAVCWYRVGQAPFRAPTTISASRRRPGTGISSTWCGSSCSASSTCGAAEPHPGRPPWPSTIRASRRSRPGRAAACPRRGRLHAGAIVLPRPLKAWPAAQEFEHGVSDENGGRLP